MEKIRVQDSKLPISNRSLLTIFRVENTLSIQCSGSGIRDGNPDPVVLILDNKKIYLCYF
jgi:hypothetical protein